MKEDTQIVQGFPVEDAVSSCMTHLRIKHCAELRISETSPSWDESESRYMVSFDGWHSISLSRSCLRELARRIDEALWNGTSAAESVVEEEGGAQ